MEPSAFSAGLRGRCPRCGQGHIFSGYLKLRPACEVCGLDLAFADTGDGPAFFVMSIVGVVVVGLALWLEFTYEPPFWVHAAVALPVVFILSGLLMKPLKGAMVAAQYHQRAEQGRLEP